MRPPHRWCNIVSVLASSALDCGFEPRSGQINIVESGVKHYRPNLKEKEQRLSGATCLSVDLLQLFSTIKKSN